MKKLFIAEKPSVAQQFAEALSMDLRGSRKDGYLESGDYIVTWCVGHLVTMSYPEKYDEKLKKWSFDTLPFIPESYRYEVIPGVKKQFKTVSELLKRKDVETIYVCTDSGREGEYIYRLVEQQAKLPKGKERRRVWIDSQTREEILRGIREAKPESEYNALAAAAFSRAKEDYLMGINFSRALTLRYGRDISRRLGKEKSTVVAAGRVMTCVLGMIVRREQEIRAFQKTVYYKFYGEFQLPDGDNVDLEAENGGNSSVSRIEAEWRGRENSPKYKSSELYENRGFLKKERAVEFMKSFLPFPREATVDKIEKKKETKNPPLLYNLAELQNDCAKLFKINPDETLAIAQELYEKKLTTYPRTDARVLSTAVSKEIANNIRGLSRIPELSAYAEEVLASGSYKSIGKSKYTDDKKITDHYAIIPTGQGISEFSRLKPLSRRVYELLARRFLAIFYPPAIYEKISLSLISDGESFQTSLRLLKSEGYLRVMRRGTAENGEGGQDKSSEIEGNVGDMEDKEGSSANAAMPEGTNRKLTDAEQQTLREKLLSLKKGQRLRLRTLRMQEGETAPPKRYTSGSMILAMENAGNLIEDEELRAQIKGSGIGTSATRAGILTKLQKIGYIALNKKTQVLSPTKLGELITEAVSISVRQLLNPELTASWERGLSYVAEGSISEAEYMQKLDAFVRSRTEAIKRA